MGRLWLLICLLLFWVITFCTIWFLYLCIKYQFLVLPIWFIIFLNYVFCFGNTFFILKLFEVILYFGNAFLFCNARSISYSIFLICNSLTNMLREMLLFIVASGIGLVFYIPEGRFLLTSVVFLRDMASEMVVYYYSSEAQFCLLFG